MEKTRVLVVDDSVVFRSQIRAALESSSEIEVAGVANNGKIALQKLEQLSGVGVVALDLEMPELGGIETLREIRRRGYPVRVIMFSALTKRGSIDTLEALSAGADDFLAKPEVAPGVGIDGATQAIARDLVPKILQFKTRTQKSLGSSAVGASRVGSATTGTRAALTKEVGLIVPQALVIGSSTGGPAALERVFSGIRGPLRCPIFVAQHMPPVFTAALAKRLFDLTGIPAAEARDQEIVEPNRIYVAPGDYHMNVTKAGGLPRIRLDQGPPRNSVRPAVDPLFESAAKIWGASLVGVVLTGMGEDGLIGARAIKESGGSILIQDEASCVVFGMPGAIYREGIHDKVAGLSEINRLIEKWAAPHSGAL